MASPAQAQTLRQRRLLALRGRAAAVIATSSHYLVWEYESSDERPLPPLIQRDERSGRTRRLAPAALPQFGVAATRTYVVYARSHHSRSELWAVRHDGTHRTQLSRSLATPVAARGERVAWAEQSGNLQRVLVRNMATGREWIAASLPRCRRGRCYRIDAVTLADDGVVFDRGAVGTHPSLIVRRRFGAKHSTTVTVANDPQPDLARSSAGALYFWLQHGWMRWDFRAKRPRRTGLDGLRWWVIGYERGRMLVRTGSPCRPLLIIRLAGKRVRVPAPATGPGSTNEFGPLCHLMTSFAWEGRRLVVAWAVIPKVSLNAHTDAGLSGVVLETSTP